MALNKKKDIEKKGASILVQTNTSRRMGRGRGGPGLKPIGRAIRYLGGYRRLTFTAYLFVFISVAAQLMVPQMVQLVLDAVTNGMIAQQIAGIPPAFQAVALERVGWTAEQYDQYANSAVRRSFGRARSLSCLPSFAAPFPLGRPTCPKW